eukprot:352983-Chlamydomonas_euryale.AAC.7
MLAGLRHCLSTGRPTALKMPRPTVMHPWHGPADCQNEEETRTWTRMRCPCQILQHGKEEQVRQQPGDISGAAQVHLINLSATARHASSCRRHIPGSMLLGKAFDTSP